MLRLAAALVITSVVAGATVAHAQDRGRSFRPAPFDRGLLIAAEICATCHAIYRDETDSPHPIAPPFREIAETPGMSRAALLVALRTSHVSMPNLMLRGADARAVVTYILSLRRR